MRAVGRGPSVLRPPSPEEACARNMQPDGGARRAESTIMKLVATANDGAQKQHQNFMVQLNKNTPHPNSSRAQGQNPRDIHAGGRARADLIRRAPPGMARRRAPAGRKRAVCLRVPCISTKRGYLSSIFVMVVRGLRPATRAPRTLPGASPATESDAGLSPLVASREGCRE